MHVFLVVCFRIKWTQTGIFVFMRKVRGRKRRSFSGWISRT
jgi:hypothetical protein